MHTSFLDINLVPDDEVARLMTEYKARERRYAPASTVRTDYLHHLVDVHDDHRGLSSARSKAVHYIIYAFGRLGLAAATAFNAVNYLDRFFSINCHLSWEVWMVEVVSVACLSVACKLDEVNIPSLHDLQMEEVMRHSFRASTIRDMELTLLKALQWRHACVTPYSFLDLLLLPTAATASRCTRLLLGSLPEPSFLRFDASVIAASALRCVLPLQDHAHLTHPLCQMDNDAHECFKMMKALDTSLDHHNHKYSDHQWSPILVIPIADGVLEAWGASKNFGLNVEALSTELLFVKATMETASGKQLGGPAMEELLQKLRDSAHGAEDLLDELDYFRIHDGLHGTYDAADEHAKGGVHNLALNARHTAKAVGKLLGLSACSSAASPGDPGEEDARQRVSCCAWPRARQRVRGNSSSAPNANQTDEEVSGCMRKLGSCL